MFQNRSLLPLCATLFLLGACANQSIQRDYNTTRDECRAAAEQRVGVSEGGEGTTNKNTKTQLVKVFSDCMNKQGWTVPGPSDEKKPAPAAAAAPPPPPPPQTVVMYKSPRDKRTMECDFARQAADSSVVAHKRAGECNAECNDLRRILPGGPRPPACP